MDLYQCKYFFFLYLINVYNGLILAVYNGKCTYCSDLLTVAISKLGTPGPPEFEAPQAQ